MNKVKLCPCGFPQSYPIPHEHDLTEREKQIIKHYERLLNLTTNKGVNDNGIYLNKS